MGAIFSLEMLWVHPEIFSSAAGLSLPAFFENEKMVTFFEKHPAPNFPVKIYFDHGNYGDDQDYEPAVKRYYSKLLSLGISPPQIFYRIFPFADHNEAAWSRRLDTPLKFMLKN